MRKKKKVQFVLVCPHCGHDDNIVEYEGRQFFCEGCESEFDYHEADYTLKELWEEY